MSDEDERDNILVMFDDEGNEQELYVFGSVEYDNDIYLIVSENLEPDEDVEEEDVIVLKEIKSHLMYDDYEEDDNDNEKIDYQVVEDDDLIDIILSKFDEEQDEE